MHNGNDTIDLSREIVFASPDPSISRRISGLEKKGVLRKIAPRIYSTNLHDAPENIVRRNLFDIVVWRVPNAVLSHRSAYEMAPTASGNLFLTTFQNRQIADIPGIRLNLIKGSPALDSDIRLGKTPLYVSSEYRRALEILQPSRKSPDESKSLPTAFIEGKIEKMITVGGEKETNAFRDRVRTVAAELGMDIQTLRGRDLCAPVSGILQNVCKRKQRKDAGATILPQGSSEPRTQRKRPASKGCRTGRYDMPSDKTYFSLSAVIHHRVIGGRKNFEATTK